MLSTTTCVTPGAGVGVRVVCAVTTRPNAAAIAQIAQNRSVIAGSSPLLFPRLRPFRRIPVPLMAAFARRVDLLARVEEPFDVPDLDRPQGRQGGIVKAVRKIGPGRA